jgi:homoserine O-acetyltransferase
MRKHALPPASLLVLFAAIFSLAPRAFAADGDQQFADLGTCKLASGQQIDQCRLGYRTWGTLNPQRSNAIFFPSWFSGHSSDIANFVGPDKMIDPAKFYLVAIDALGDGISSSPSNSTHQHGPAFPAFTTRDMVDVEYRFATGKLGLKHLYAVMGISMGGMQTFEWMVNYPDFIDIAIPIVGSTRLTGYDLLLWHTEEDALKSDPAWHEGHYTKSPPMGVVQAIHRMNVTTPAYYARENPPGKFASVYADYFTTGIAPFDANDWLAQLEAMIHHDVAHGGSLADAAAKVKARVLVVAAAQDHMVNPQPALDFAAQIKASTLVLESDCGHRAPGCESAKMYPAVRDFLQH